MEKNTDILLWQEPVIKIGLLLMRIALIAIAITAEIFLYLSAVPWQQFLGAIIIALSTTSFIGTYMLEHLVSIKVIRYKKYLLKKKKARMAYNAKASEECRKKLKYLV